MVELLEVPLALHVRQRVAHGLGSVPKWQLFSKEGFGDVKQTRPSDSSYLYLISTIEVITGIEVFE